MAVIEVSIPEITNDSLDITIGVKLKVKDGKATFNGGWVKKTYGQSKTQIDKKEKKEEIAKAKEITESAKQEVLEF